MSDRFSSSEKVVIDRDNRNMSLAGYPMGTELNDLWAAIDGGNIGITAVAGDVDAIAKAAASRPLAFAQDLDTTTGLTFGHKGGNAFFGQALVTVAAGTVALTNTAINYVEVNSAGTVSANTTAFTLGSVPLYLVTCAAGAISLVVNARVLLRAMQDAGITGRMLAAAVRTRTLMIPLGDADATDTWCVRVPVAGNVTRVSLVNESALVANDTDYRTLGVVNLGQAGAGTTKIVDSTVAANSTKATGGAGLAANVDRVFTLAADPADDVAANDVLQITLTKAASAGALSKAMLSIDVAVD